MKRFLSFFIGILLSIMGNIYSQDKEDNVFKSKQEFSDFIDSMVLIYYPQEAIDKKIEGIVKVEAEISKQGYLYNIKIDESLDSSCDSIALCIVHSMQQRYYWYPSDGFYPIIIDVPFSLKNIEKRPVICNRYYNELAQLPLYDGGTLELLKYLSNNNKINNQVYFGKIEGRVVITFIISDTGEIRYPLVIFDSKSINIPAYEAESIRLIKEMPLNWTPGKNEKGESVNCFYTIPVRFRLY